MTYLKRRSTDIFILAISTFILAMLCLGNGKMSFELILFSTVVCIVLTKAGEFTLRVGQLTTIKARLPSAFVAGFVAISLPMVALTSMFNISALSAFAISAALLFILNAFSFKKVMERPRNNWGDVAITIVLLIIIGLLAKVPVSSHTTLLNTGVLPIWSDYFIHGATIASFGSPFATGIDMELAGESRGFYHYAPFMIPAAFQVVSGMSGLALSTSLLLPLGLLVAALGSYAFAVELGGRLGGLLALTAIICLPASSVFIQSGWFDFYWLLFIAPGSGYAIGVSMVVCALMVIDFNNNDNRLPWLTLLLLFSLVLIRVHMFMLLAPVVISLVLIRRFSINIRLLIIISISMLFIIIAALYCFPNLHKLWIELCYPHVYLKKALEWSLFYGSKISIFEYPLLTSLVQLFIVLVAILGVYFILYPLFFGISVKRFGFSIIDALPLFLLVCFIGLMLFSPAARNGDYSEYKHRHFLLLYVIIAVYTITYAYNLANNLFSNKNKFEMFNYTLVICFFSVTILLNWNANPSRPNILAMPWAASCHMNPITPGAFESAEYIKTHAKHGDVFAMGGKSVGNSTVSNSIIEIISLSGVPAFIARPGIKSRGPRYVHEIVPNRLRILKELSSFDNWLDAQKFMLANGIRWFLLSNGEKPKWDLTLENVAFSSNGMSVFDAGLSTN